MYVCMYACIYTYIKAAEEIACTVYIYHALIDALNAHTVHVNLNTMFYTHVEQGPASAIHIKYYLKQKKMN